MSLKVWQVDPVHMTPYYDHALCSALAEAGCAVCHVTSPYLYDPALPTPVGYRREYVYFRGMHHTFWLEYPRLRRVLRAALYPLGHCRLIRELDRDPADVVHIQWSRLPRFDVRLIRQIKRRGIPVVHTVHDVEPLFVGGSAEDFAEIHALSDRLVVHTNANRDLLLARFPNLRDKVRVIPHVALEWKTPLNASRLNVRRDLGLVHLAPVLLFFGSIRAYKGLDLLLEAFTYARRACPEMLLLVAGRVENAPTLRLLKRHSDHVILRPGYVPFDQVWKYHLAADVATFPYRRISQSGELMTAMSFGLPVIVTDVGGLPETVDGNGWVVSANDPVALAQALIEAVRDRERLRVLASRSLQLIDQRHAPARVARMTVAAYAELIC